MSIVLIGSTSGSITLQEPAVSGSTVIDLPATSGTMVVTGGAQTVQFAAGSASTPSITFTGDTNTGIFSPGADTIAFTEGGVESMRIDSSGNVGIGTSSPATRLDVTGSIRASGSITLNNASGGDIQSTNGTTTVRMGIGSYLGSGLATVGVDGANPIIFVTNSAERMRINSTGVVGIGQDANAFGQFVVKFDATTSPNNSLGIGVVPVANTSNAVFMRFYNATGNGCGDISRSGTSNAVVYGTTSDYRLKENVQPMTGALDKVAQLKPVTYTWIDSQEQAEGFIAHELQEIIPTAVVGEKDAVDSEGNPKYQNMDTSYLVATLTAAIQEQQAIITDLKARIETLENK